MFLPNEIWLEILSWLTVESLLRCKCVCKQWQAMVLDRKFLELHMRRNKAISHYTNREETLTIDGVKETYKYLHSLDGLLLEISASRKYILRNPSIKQVVVVPSPHESDVYTFIYFHSSSSTYRIMSIHNSVTSTIGGGQILDLGASDLSWRPFNIFKYHGLDEYRYELKCQLRHNVLYIFRSLLDMSSASSRNPVIFSIDLQKEEVCKSVVNVPKCLFSTWKDIMFISWDNDNKMALAQRTGKEIVIWVLEDYKKQKWCDTKIVIPLPNVEIKSVRFPWNSYGGVVWIYLNGNTWYNYFIETKLLRTSATTNSNAYNRVPNKATLVTVNAMRPKIKEIRE